MRPSGYSRAGRRVTLLTGASPHQRPLEYQRANFVDVYGYGGPNSLMALIQRLHMENYGTTLEQIGKIAVAQR